eukprot:scaffold16024_cov101-Isochrysis_galbana.AAC.1
MQTSTYGGHGRRALDPAASLTGRRRICAGLMKWWVSVPTGSPRSVLRKPAAVGNRATATSWGFVSTAACCAAPSLDPAIWRR